MKWDMGRQYAYRLIASANVMNTLSPIGDIKPITETQTRPLARLEPEKQKEAWQMANVINNVGTIVPITPATESQTRHLARLEPEKQKEAWQRAVETAPNGKVTADHKACQKQP